LNQHSDLASDETQEPTSAWALAFIYVTLIVYASLYPFQDWRNQDLTPWNFLFSGWPRYWSEFDVVSNILGYAPLGFFLTLASLRVGRMRAAWLTGVCFATALSFLMESLQSYLPARVPSSADLLFNCAGAMIGSSASFVLERVGLLARWSLFRGRWFSASTRGVNASLVLLAIWPFALLFPCEIPLGLGQIQARTYQALLQVLEDTPFLEWMPNLSMQTQPMAPSVELVCIALGLLTPFLLGAAVIKRAWQKIVFLCLVVAVACLLTALSTALSFGPIRAWSWINSLVIGGLILGTCLSLVSLRLESRSYDVFLIIIIVVQLFLINQNAEDVYLVQTLKTWEQGRFIRFNGLAQWLGWIWPFAVLALIFYKLLRGVKLKNMSLK
jgi:VanZ family protein